MSTFNGICCLDDSDCGKIRPRAYRGNPAHLAEGDRFGDFQPMDSSNGGEIFSGISYNQTLDNHISYSVSGDSKRVYHCVGHGGVHSYLLENYYSTGSLNLSTVYNFRGGGGDSTFEYADEDSGNLKTGRLGTSGLYRYGYEPNNFSGSYDCCPATVKGFNYTSNEFEITNLIVVAEGVDGVSVYDSDTGALLGQVVWQDSIIKSVKAITHGEYVFIYAGSVNYEPDANGTDLPLPPPWNPFVPPSGFADQAEYAYALNHGYKSLETDGFSGVVNRQFKGGRLYGATFKSGSGVQKLKMFNEVTEGESLSGGSDFEILFSGGNSSINGIAVDPRGVLLRAGDLKKKISSDCVIVHYSSKFSTGRTDCRAIPWGIHSAGEGGEKTPYVLNPVDTSIDEDDDGFFSLSSSPLHAEISSGDLFVSRYYDGEQIPQAVSDTKSGLKIFKKNSSPGTGKIAFFSVVEGGNVYKDVSSVSVPGPVKNASIDIDVEEKTITVGGQSIEIGCMSGGILTDLGEGFSRGDIIEVSGQVTEDWHVPAKIKIEDIVSPKKHWVNKWGSGQSYMMKGLTTDYLYYYGWPYNLTTPVYGWNYLVDKIDVYSSFRAGNSLILSLYEGGLLVLCDIDDSPDNLDAILNTTVTNHSSHLVSSLSRGVMQSLFILDSWSDGKTIFSADCLQSSVLGGPRQLGLYECPEGYSGACPEVSDSNRSWLWFGTHASPGGLMASEIVD